MLEEEVEKRMREHLKIKGWTLTNDPRLVGQHDWDIRAWHPKWRKVMLVEAKGDGKGEKNKAQKMHGSFYTMLGQVMARMDIKGNSNNCARTYAIAIPSHWEKMLKGKVENMRFGWNLLKLNVFLVDKKGITKKTYRYFL